MIALRAGQATPVLLEHGGELGQFGRLQHDHASALVRAAFVRPGRIHVGDVTGNRRHLAPLGTQARGADIKCVEDLHSASVSIRGSAVG